MVAHKASISIQIRNMPIGGNFRLVQTCSRRCMDKIVLFENQAFKPKKDKFSADLLWANFRTVPTNTEVFLPSL